MHNPQNTPTRIYRRPRRSKIDCGCHLAEFHSHILRTLLVTMLLRSDFPAGGLCLLFHSTCLAYAVLDEPSISVDKVQLTKSVNTLGGTLSLNPKYDVKRGAPDVSVGYSVGATSLKVDAEQKRLTVAHTFAGRNKITPTITAGGDFSLSYSRDLVLGGKLSTTWTPDDSVKVTWNDGGWDATVTAPLDGPYRTNGGIKFNVKRNVELPL
jgi:hypothetical protein